MRFRDVFRRRESTTAAGDGSPVVVETAHVDDNETGHVDDQPAERWGRGIRPRRTYVKTVYGPVGLLAIRFPGCEVWADDSGSPYMGLAVVGEGTVRRVVVVRSLWRPVDVECALLLGGRLVWVGGDFRDVHERAAVEFWRSASLAGLDSGSLVGLRKVYPT